MEKLDFISIQNFMLNTVCTLPNQPDLIEPVMLKSFVKSWKDQH